MKFTCADETDRHDDLGAPCPSCGYLTPIWQILVVDTGDFVAGMFECTNPELTWCVEHQQGHQCEQAVIVNDTVDALLLLQLGATEITESEFGLLMSMIAVTEGL